jgi:methane/ammonia monooxygenase subunit A
MKNNRQILEVAGIGPKGARYSRIFDFMVVTAVILLFAGVIHLHSALTVGDWDMFIDWKDRQYWPLVTPISMIMLPAALQAAFWTHFRLPIGATVGGVVFMLAVWIARYFAWHVWAYYPFPMMVPNQILAGCMMMDAILVITASSFFTSIIGGFFFSLLFYPGNFSALGAYYLPVAHLDSVASVADLVAYVYPRSGTPEYIRIVERGTLRTFGDHVIWVSAAFGGFICIIMHFLWWKIGTVMATDKFIENDVRVKRLMGIKDGLGATNSAGGVPVAAE